MKKLKAVILMVAVFLLSGITVLAGSINEHEQRVLDTVSTPVNYNGKEYVAAEQYINRLTAYMNQDNVDLSASQADKAIDTFFDNIAMGIKEGYMVPVESESEDDGKGSGNKDDSKNEDENDDSSTGNGGDDSINETEEATTVATEKTTGASTDKKTSGESTTTIEETTDAELSEEEIARLQKERDMVDTIVEKYSLAEEEADVYAELEEVESMMEEAAKDYSDAEPYQSQISLGMIAIIVVVVVAVVMVGIIFWHKNISYRK